MLHFIMKHLIKFANKPTGNVYFKFVWSVYTLGSYVCFHHVLFLCKIPYLWCVVGYARARNLVIHNGASPWEFQAHACYHENKRAPFQETISIISVWVITLLQTFRKLHALISPSNITPQMAAYWFARSRVQFSGQRPAILTEVVCNFPQLLQLLFTSLSSGVWRRAVWLAYQCFGGTCCFHL
jgi:hypothetical protein